MKLLNLILPIIILIGCESPTIEHGNKSDELAVSHMHISGFEVPGKAQVGKEYIAKFLAYRTDNGSNFERAEIKVMDGESVKIFHVKPEFPEFEWSHIFESNQVYEMEITGYWPDGRDIYSWSVKVDN